MIQSMYDFFAKIEKKFSLRLKMIKPRYKRKLLLNKEQRKNIWGESGPYSEAYFIIETRILDDTISRVFLEVEVSISPLTFEFIEKHKEQFKDNQRIRNILEYAAYTDEAHGYKASLFSVPYGPDLLETANKVLQETEEAIITMHKFVMNHFDIHTN